MAFTLFLENFHRINSPSCSLIIYKRKTKHFLPNLALKLSKKKYLVCIQKAENEQMNSLSFSKNFFNLYYRKEFKFIIPEDQSQHIQTLIKKNIKFFETENCPTLDKTDKFYLDGYRAWSKEKADRFLQHITTALELKIKNFSSHSFLKNQ